MVYRKTIGLIDILEAIKEILQVISIEEMEQIKKDLTECKKTQQTVSNYFQSQSLN